MKRIAILGAGTAGTMMANKLVQRLPASEWEVVVVDRDDVHIYQPGLLMMPFGVYEPEDLVRPRTRTVRPEVRLSLDGVERIEPDNNRLVLGNGETLRYDLLIVATGTRIVPEETEGLTGAGWGETAFDFYTLEGAKKLRRRLDTFRGGRLIVNVVDMPIKCPVAPLEFLFLADSYFRELGIRDRVDITYATPLSGAFTKPRASAALGHLLEEKGINIEANFNTSGVDGEGRKLLSYDGRSLEYELLASIPLHHGSEVIAKSGMGDDFGFLPTNKNTLVTDNWPNIFALGDCTNLPTSKAGSVAHFQAEVLIENIVRHIHDRPALPEFDGHANCFIETGHGKAMLIDFNYDTEPLPGSFPLPVVGPFRLLGESHMNHWGKLAFKWVYWNLLLPGAEIPLDHRMLLAGKEVAA